MKTMLIAGLLLISLSIITGCKKNNYNPNPLNSTAENIAEKVSVENFIKPENFVEEVTNLYYPLAVGDTLYYYVVEVDEDDTLIQNSFVAVTPDVKVIQGITCKVIRDIVFQDGILVEDTYDWYVQDINGNVWYFGEDTKSLQEDGSWSTEGSWESGVDGAIAGIIMPGNPEKYVGKRYRQEHYEGHAEDKAIIQSTNETVTIGLGTFSNCLKIKEFTPLEPGITEHKWYAPGIGEIKKAGITGVIEDGELVGMN